MLNLAIAVMGDTYDRVVESKDYFTMTIQIRMYDAYADALNWNQSQDFFQYLYIVTEKKSDDSKADDHEWTGRVGKIERTVKHEISK